MKTPNASQGSSLSTIDNLFINSSSKNKNSADCPVWGIPSQDCAQATGEKGIEVVGTGVVTLVDPTYARTNIDGLEDEGLLELLGLRLHTLPSGHRYPVNGAGGADLPSELPRAVQRLVQPGPVRL